MDGESCLGSSGQLCWVWLKRGMADCMKNTEKDMKQLRIAAVLTALVCEVCHSVSSYQREPFSGAWSRLAENSLTRLCGAERGRECRDTVSMKS